MMWLTDPQVFKSDQQFSSFSDTRCEGNKYFILDKQSLTISAIYRTHIVLGYQMPRFWMYLRLLVSSAMAGSLP